MTSMITFLVFVLALLLAVVTLSGIGATLQVRAACRFSGLLKKVGTNGHVLLQRKNRGSITAFLIIAISPVRASEPRKHEFSTLRFVPGDN
jgi:hypothetical protein